MRGPMLNQGRGAPLSHLPPPHPTGLYKYICFLKTICFSSYTVLLIIHMNFTSIHPFYSLSSFTIFFFLSLFSRVHATQQPALSVGRLVGLLVGWSVTLYFFYVFISLTTLLLPKWSGDLKYGPCPPARDWGSSVSGLV